MKRMLHTQTINGEREKERRWVITLRSVYACIRWRPLAQNSRQDKFIRYFRLDCPRFGQKLQLELANRKLVLRNVNRATEKFQLCRGNRSFNRGKQQQ